MTRKSTSIALLLALAAGGCHAAAGLAGNDGMGPHKLKGPATAMMDVPPTDPLGERKDRVRSQLVRADTEESRWTH